MTSYNINLAINILSKTNYSDRVSTTYEHSVIHIGVHVELYVYPHTMECNIYGLKLIIINRGETFCQRHRVKEPTEIAAEFPGTIFYLFIFCCSERL